MLEKVTFRDFFRWLLAVFHHLRPEYENVILICSVGLPKMYMHANFCGAATKHLVRSPSYIGLRPLFLSKMPDQTFWTGRYALIPTRQVAETFRIEPCMFALMSLGFESVQIGPGAEKWAILGCFWRFSASSRRKSGMGHKIRKYRQGPQNICTKFQSSRSSSFG